jgi:hypothetical protein
VRLLAIRLGRDENVDADLHARRRMDHLVAAVALREALSNVTDVKGV